LKDASIPYDISLQLRNSDFYPYQNIWIIFAELHPTAETAVNDTIEYRLADASGKWTGNGITLFQNRFPLRTDYHFPDTGQYTIGIRHGMRDDLLKGIENVGLMIEKHK
jgi:gliding motility-associated lipoprotein GldH